MTGIKDAPQAKDFMNRHVQTVTPDMALGDNIKFKSVTKQGDVSPKR